MSRPGTTEASGPVALTQAEAASEFEKFLSGEEPQGQPVAAQEETDPDVTGDELEAAEPEGEQPDAELIEVPKLDGDGTEKLV